MTCIVCNGAQWSALPIPTAARSITTSGVLLAEGLEREQCDGCGLLRKARGEFLGNTDFYEKQYQNYYERPGVTTYDRARYEAMADWMGRALAGFRPVSILDVGCGSGISMQATLELYPGARIEGVEPSADNAKKGVDAGLKISVKRLAPAGPSDAKHDLVYSNNVFQHVTEPDAFFRIIAGHVASDGRLVMVLPDADEPSSEMLWADHNYSFRRSDLAQLAKKAGMRLIEWQPNPEDNNLLNKQLAVFAHKSYAERNGLAAELAPDAYDVADLQTKREAQLTAWQGLDAELINRVGAARRVYNFGASMWSWLLAGYCPQFWSRVECALVDGQNGKCIDKPVRDPSDIQFSADDCIVLGVNPANQTVFADKLKPYGARIVSWSDIISI